MRERIDMIGRTSGSGLALAVATAAIFTACDGTSDTACTEIGCGDGLYVVVQATPGAELEIEAVETGGETRTESCVVGLDGSCEVGFNGFTPEEVTLTVTGGEQALSVTLQPTYEDFQPNGPDCPPVCRQARAEVDLTSGA
jgi:hypothetical protein